MRSLLLVSTLLAVPGLALADPPQCALPSAPATAVSLPVQEAAPLREADQNFPGQPPPRADPGTAGRAGTIEGRDGKRLADRGWSA